MKKPINPTLANWQSQKKQPTQSEQTTPIKIDMPAPKALADTNQPPPNKRHPSRYQTNSYSRYLYQRSC